jgi:hypothetical protein
VVALWQSMLHFGTVKKYSCWEMRNALPWSVAVSDFEAEYVV